MARPAKEIRVLVVDDHALVLAGLSTLIEQKFHLVGALGDARELLAAAEQLNPDVILLDVAMPGLNGIQAARKLRTRAPNARVIFVTVHDQRVFVDAAFEAGARGYVLKRSAPDELIRAIEEVADGKLYVTPLVDGPVGPGFLSPPPLTDRQLEVLRWIASGLSTKEIASKLCISAKAVEFHRGRIRYALKVKSTAELTRYAIKNGITPL